MAGNVCRNDDTDCFKGPFNGKVTLVTSLTVDHLEYSIGARRLLAGVSFSIERGERIGLLGRNGEGKSTLLNIIAGQRQAEDGQLIWRMGCRAAMVGQEPIFTENASVFTMVVEGLGENTQLLADYHRAANHLATSADSSDMALLDRLQQQLEAVDGWQLEQRVNTVISQLDLPADKPVAELSGGWQRRVALARALVQEPALLLLDEPTNHLDMEAIEWLENTLVAYPGAVLFVTHDRRFLRRLATRIFELDRGSLTAWPGDYDNYLRRLEERQNEEARHQAKFDKRLAEEEVWIRQGIKARRTRNEGRVRALQALRVERKARVARQGKVEITVSGEQSGKLVIEAENVTKSYADKPLIKDFSCRILRGDRIGLLGPNGVGKTTLLNLLVGELQPDAGWVRQGSQLQVAYFDQHRAQLREDRSALENVAEGSDSITINGHSLHPISYLKRFLFTPERARSLVATLSGGERNRLLLARLFTRPANLLVLDEPTNDLDLQTLEVLEDLLMEYQGTLLLVSHDREFIDQVVTSVFAFEGQGRVNSYVGGYNDWLAQRPSPAPAASTTAKKPAALEKVQKPARNTKLSYKLSRELEALPERIESLEQAVAQQQEKIASADFYQQSETVIKTELDQLQILEHALEAVYTRWEELEAMNNY